MADSKYADLPGIAYNQVDVYETNDLPESEQYSGYSEDDETDSIEKLHISASEAFNKFKGKYIVTKGVDFSDKISKKPRTGYNAVFGVWEVPGEGEKETSIQKCQRLQCEIKELYDEVYELKEKAKEEKEMKDSMSILSQLEEAGKQLNNLNLNECLGVDLIATLNDPHGIKLKQLESEIKQFKIIGNDKNDKDKTKITSSDGEKSSSGVLKYELMYYPEKSKMQQVARVIQLEQRLAKLENMIGKGDDQYLKFTQNLKSQGILETVQQLAAKSALLNSAQVDIMESKITCLNQKMDIVVQKKSNLSSDIDRDKKIIEMYDTMKKVESIADILPQAVERMISLNEIHNKAGEFYKSLIQLEELETQTISNIENQKSFLKGIQESFANNLQVIQENMKSLEERITKINN